MNNEMHYKTQLIEHLKGLIEYWLKQPDISEREKMEGVIFSTLVAIDGAATTVGPYVLKPIKEDGKWGPDIGGDLHDLFYKIKPGNTKGVRLPKKILLAIDDAGIHIRETVFVEHNDITGVARYDAKRMFSINNPEIKRQILAIVRKNYQGPAKRGRKLKKAKRGSKKQ